MTEFEQIKKSIAELTARLERAKGQIEVIEKQWDSKYGTHDVDELAKMVDEAEAELESKRTEYDKLLSEVMEALEKVGVK